MADRFLRGALKALLVGATLLFLASMGGGMVVAGWLLVPLHWLAGRDSGAAGTAGWALLAGLSITEMAGMLAYIATGSGGAVVLAMSVGFLGGSAGFVWLRSRRLPSLGRAVTSA